jgi:release factor glutamine methyltransferase
MGVNIQTIKDIKVYLATELENICFEPELSAIISIVISAVTGLTRIQQMYSANLEISPDQGVRVADICKELKTGKPVQYILGETIFYGCSIKVNSFTLIPRPETEELVDLVIKDNPGFHNHIVDIGTGSGCIAIALAANFPGAKVTGTDISGEAILLAQENAILNNVKVNFIKNDIFNFDFERFDKADIVVSNPPYVRQSERQFMNSNVLNFEPHLALFVDDSDPLIFYKVILETSQKLLQPGGMVYFEINEALGELMKELLLSFSYIEVDIIKDINGRDRIIKGRKDVGK